MSISRKLITILGAIFILLIAIGFIMSRPSVKEFSEVLPTPRSNSSTDIGRVPRFSPPSEDKLRINGVVINNFYKENIARTGGNVIFFENPEYQLAYNIDSQVFTITLLTPEIEQTKQLAQRAFLSELGIDSKQACKLTVEFLTLPEWEYLLANNNKSLSFCE